MEQDSREKDQIGRFREGDTIKTTDSSGGGFTFSKLKYKKDWVGILGSFDINLKKWKVTWEDPEAKAKGIDKGHISIGKFEMDKSQAASKSNSIADTSKRLIQQQTKRSLHAVTRQIVPDIVPKQRPKQQKSASESVPDALTNPMSDSGQ